MKKKIEEKNILIITKGLLTEKKEISGSINNITFCKNGIIKMKKKIVK